MESRWSSQRDVERGVEARERALAAEDLQHLEDAGAHGAAGDGDAHRLRELARACRPCSAMTSLKAALEAATVQASSARSRRGQLRERLGAIAGVRNFAAAVGIDRDVVGEVVAAALDELDERLGALLQRDERLREPRVVAGHRQPGAAEERADAASRELGAGDAPSDDCQFTHCIFSRSKTPADLPIALEVEVRRSARRA